MTVVSLIKKCRQMPLPIIIAVHKILKSNNARHTHLIYKYSREHVSENMRKDLELHRKVIILCTLSNITNKYILFGAEIAKYYISCSYEQANRIKNCYPATPHSSGYNPFVNNVLEVWSREELSGVEWLKRRLVKLKLGSGVWDE